MADTAPESAGTEPKGGLLRFLLTLALLAWAIRSFVVAPFNIPSGSMLPTLYIGDYLVVAKWPYGYSRYSFPFDFPPFRGRVLGGVPKRGDVAVFRHPSGGIDLIKRVIAVPGDTVEVRSGAVVLNGKPLVRQRLAPVAIPVSANSPCRVRPFSPTRESGGNCLYPAWRETLPGGPSYTVLDQVDDAEGDNFGPVTVLPGQIFLMGDNRDDSLDSRFEAYRGGIGMVPTEYVIGRALVTFWSTDGSASYINPISWFQALRADRIGNGYADQRE
jgi:signal peptidase I